MRFLVDKSKINDWKLETSFYFFSQVTLRNTCENGGPQEKRTPFHLYVDEMQSFISLAFADILAEARKYGLSVFLCHQYIAQLNEKIRAAVFGNVGTMIAFRVGAEDAEMLEKEFEPVFTREDLVNAPRFFMHIKLQIDGATSKPFSGVSLPHLNYFGGG